jgi:hypothetical protein
MVNHHPLPLQVVLERLGCGDPARGVLFFWDEVKRWPSGALDSLVKGGVLRQAQPMAVVECDGCEENCVMPVVVYPAQEDKPGRAFINCDKRDDIGRIRVDFRRMEQWQSSGELIAAALVQILDFIEPAKAIDGKRWNVGVLKGNANNKSLIVLLAEDGLKLSLAGHTVALSEVLTAKENALVLDKSKLVRLVNDPVGNTETPEARRNRLAARIKEEKAKRTKAFNQVVAAEEGISVPRLKQILELAKPALASPFAAVMPSTKPSQKKSKSKH